eukprot:354526_1
MSLFKLSTLLVITWCWWLSLAMTGCPNEGFKMVARYKQEFKLNSGTHAPYKRYWIAFGSKGQWVINLVDSKIETEHDLHYSCDEKYFVFFARIEENNLPICCAATHSIDQSIQNPPEQAQPEQAQPTQSHAFAVLPNEYYTALHTKHALQKVQTSSLEQRAVHHANEASFVWMQKIKRLPSAQSALGVSDLSARVTASMLWPMKMTAEFYRERNSIWSLQVPFATKEGPDTSECIVNAQWLQCDTAITNDIVVFHLVCDEYSLIRFGFSSNGIFKISGFLDCKANAARTSYWDVGARAPTPAQKIRFFPISKLYPEGQHVPSYSSIELGWKLGAFCGSCPSISFTMKVSEQEAQSNKERLQHALASTLTLSSLPVSVKYTRTWYKESAVTLASGRATTITASCNGLDLYYWSVGIGTWGAGATVIPTQFFYCTDRNKPPICKPKITATMNEGNEGFGRLCSGHDVESDFDTNTDVIPREQGWGTLHSGKAQPIRIQGQKQGEPPFRVLQRSEIAHLHSAKTAHLHSAIVKGLGNARNVLRQNQLQQRVRALPAPNREASTSLTSAHMSEASQLHINKWNGEDIINDKGLFLAAVAYDDNDDIIDMDAESPYIAAYMEYKSYNDDFQSESAMDNRLIIFIASITLFCVFCALSIAISVAFFMFGKHTAGIPKNQLSEVTSYEVSEV